MHEQTVNRTSALGLQHTTSRSGRKHSTTSLHRKPLFAAILMSKILCIEPLSKCQQECWSVFRVKESGSRLWELLVQQRSQSAIHLQNIVHSYHPGSSDIQAIFQHRNSLSSCQLMQLRWHSASVLLSDLWGCNTCSHQHIVGGGVPAQDAHTFGVAFQLDNRFCEWRGQPAVRDLPNLFTTDKTNLK